MSRIFDRLEILQELKDDIKNLSVNLCLINGRVNDLLEMDGGDLDDDINVPDDESSAPSTSTVDSDLKIGDHVVPTTSPHKGVKGRVIEVTKYFVKIRPDNNRYGTYKKGKHLLRFAR